MTRWSVPLLDALRHRGDPEADAVMADALADADPERIAALSDFLRRWDQPVDDTVPAGVAAFLATPRPQPRWYDPDLLAMSIAWFERKGTAALLVLFHRSLPSFFAGADPARPFARLETFTPHTVRRMLLEITQLVVDLMKPGGFDNDPPGPGVQALMKLRLYHALVRVRAREAAGVGPWDDSWGVPINQEALAFATVGFAVHGLDGMARLGVVLDEREAESALLTWKLIGHWLGLDNRLQPRDVAEARDLLTQLQERLVAPSPHGAQLTDDILDVIQEIVPGQVLDDAPHALMTDLLGPEMGALLQLRPLTLAGRLELKAIRMGVDHLDAADRLLVVLGRALLQGVVRATRPGKGPFRVPLWWLEQEDQP